MLVLGIGGFMHDYNCVLFDLENKKISWCEQERISRRKHHVIESGEDLLLPIEHCAHKLGYKAKDIDTIVFAHTDPFPCKDELKKIFAKKELVEVDHHLCHAAGAFFSSKYNDSLIISTDGFGDGSSALIAHGKDNKMIELQRITDHDSIGLEYLRATVHLGLGGVGSEGKTQGLASYGQPTIFEQYMNEIEITSDANIHLSNLLKSDSSRLAEEGGYLNTQLLNNKFLNDYCPRRFSHEKMNEVHMNLAASIQKVIEYITLEMSKWGIKQTGSKNLVLSGGVSMNSSMNGIIAQSGLFKGVYALPMSSDRGIGLGAALYHIHQNMGVPRFFELDNVFYGQKFTEKEVIKEVKKSNLEYYIVDDIASEAAKYISEGKIVGWYQLESEMGARALGHRSICADPRTAEMKDIINEKVKHREWFRPFAPSVVEEKAQEFFEFDPNIQDLSFMTYTVPANENAQKNIPAVVHVDNTSRIQTVKKSNNSLYHELITRFGELTGIYCILNTSFNDNGEPIVETPRDAINTFFKTGMEILCVNNVVAKKK